MARYILPVYSEDADVKRYTFTVETEVLAELREIAANQGITTADLLRKIIDEYLEDKNGQ